jgi:anion-transporting  ArsA/GET3 family ATPase
MNSDPIDQLLLHKKILLICGTGGVGKTTLSSALGIRAASLGKKVLVVTLDPAKRLATSLGISSLDHEAKDLSSHLTHLPSHASFSASIPNNSITFKKFLRKMSLNDEQAQRLSENPLIQAFSNEYSGTNEYLALEELYRHYQSGKYDLIILDTPPSRNSIHFLRAPLLLAQLFEEKLIRWMVLPANKILAFGIRKTFSILEQLTGEGFMSSLFHFGAALSEIQEPFIKRIQEIHTLLQSDECGFILVSAPEKTRSLDLAQFKDEMKKQHYSFDLAFLNRCTHKLDLSQLADEPKHLNLMLKRKEQEQEAIQFAQKNLNPTPLYLLPELARDVRGFEDLMWLSRQPEKSSIPL